MARGRLMEARLRRWAYCLGKDVFPPPLALHSNLGLLGFRVFLCPENRGGCQLPSSSGRVPRAKGAWSTKFSQSMCMRLHVQGFKVTALCLCLAQPNPSVRHDNRGGCHMSCVCRASRVTCKTSPLFAAPRFMSRVPVKTIEWDNAPP